MKTSKKVIILLIFLAVLSLACSALRGAESEPVQEPDENTGWETLDIEGIGIKVNVPSSWHTDSYDLDEMITEGEVVFGYVSEESDSNAQFVFSAVKGYMDIQQFGDGRKRSVEENDIDTLINYDNSFRVDGHSAVLVEFTSEYESTETVHHTKQVITRNGDWFIILVFSSYEDSWDTYHGIFLNMIDKIDFY